MIQRRYTFEKIDGFWYINSLSVKKVCRCNERGMAAKISALLNSIPAKGDLESMYAVAEHIIGLAFLDRERSHEVARAVVNDILMHRRAVAVPQLKKAVSALKKWAVDNDRDFDCVKRSKLNNVMGLFDIAEDEISRTISY